MAIRTRERHDTVGNHLRTDALLVGGEVTLGEAIDLLRTSNISDQITYLYVIDSEQHLVGVLPLRRILSGKNSQLVRDVMVPDVVTLSVNDSLEHAQQFFSKYKYLSFPVLGSDRRFIGMFDITVLTGSRINTAGRNRFDEVFETIGMRASMLRYLTPHTAFRYRFPWLVPTLLSGIFCAVLTSFFETSLSGSIILAFFMTLVLGLGESVSIQTLTITIRQLRVEKPTGTWYRESVVRELLTALMLGLGTAIILGVLIFLWKHTLRIGVAIGASVVVSLCMAAFFGVSIPALLHRTRLDPKVAAGPLVLGLTDLCTLFIYFSVAGFVLA